MSGGRWELTQEEGKRLVGAEGEPYRLADLARALVRRPWIGPRVVASAARGAVLGARGDGELRWALSVERARRVLRGAAIGAAWHGAELFLDALLPRLSSDAVVLELGCGAGRISRLVAPHVGALLCTDVHRVMLAEARVNLADLGNVEVKLVRGFSLDGLPDDGFDAVYSHDVLAILDANPVLALLDEVGRVLRPGGMCVLSVYTIDDEGGARQQLAIARDAARADFFGGTMIRPYTGEFLEALLTAVGLEVVERRKGDPAAVADLLDPHERLHSVVVALKSAAEVMT